MAGRNEDVVCSSYFTFELLKFQVNARKKERWNGTNILNGFSEPEYLIRSNHAARFYLMRSIR